MSQPHKVLVQSMIFGNVLALVGPQPDFLCEDEVLHRHAPRQNFGPLPFQIPSYLRSADARQPERAWLPHSRVPLWRCPPQRMAANGSCLVRSSAESRHGHRRRRPRSCWLSHRDSRARPCSPLCRRHRRAWDRSRDVKSRRSDFSIILTSAGQPSRRTVSIPCRAPPRVHGRFLQ